MNGKWLLVKISALAFGAVLVAASVACSPEGKGPQPSSTTPDGPSSAGTATASGAGPSSDSASSGASTAAPDSTAAPSGAPTAQAWKNYADPGRKVSFDVPSDWIVQSAEAEPGSLPGALKVEVKDAAGRYLATLHTGLPAAKTVDCPAGQGRPYVVLSSQPVDLPHSDSAGTISPRAVFRVIQGYKFFGSYGITNMMAGQDGQACELKTRVQGPAGKGDYFFGDLAAIHAFAADEKVAPAKAFDTLDQAVKYVEQSPDFANVQRMLMSLRVNP